MGGATTVVDVKPSSSLVAGGTTGTGILKDSAAPLLNTLSKRVTSPLDGSQVEVMKLREHPQFPSKYIVESVEDGFQFTHPLPSVQELAKVYSEDYNEMFGRDPSVVPPFVKRRAAAQLAFMKQHIMNDAVDDNIMSSFDMVGEAGAGWGELSRAVSSFIPNAKVITYELDHDSVKSMKESGIDARYGCMEVEETGESMYDLVMTSHVTEHLLDPRGFYQRILKLLKPNGHVFVEIPLENPVPQWWGKDPEKPYWVGHLHFFAVGHLEKMLESLGYDIVATSSHDHPHSSGFVMPGDEDLYDVDKIPVEMDTQASTSDAPKALRVLARKSSSSSC